MTHPRGWLAGLITLLAPGAGHVYAGRPVRGVVIAGITTALLFVAAPVMLSGPAGLFLIVAWLVLLALAILDAWRSARHWRESARPNSGRWFVLVPALLVICSVNYLLAVRREQAAEAYRIPTAAMEPTLLIGDYLYVDKRPRARAMERGAVYVFRSTEEPDLDVVKRAVALAGDTVSMRRGVLTINGVSASEPYRKPDDSLRSETPEIRARMEAWQAPYRTESAGLDAADLHDWGPLAVPEGAFFALGDHRNESYDSRYYGFVPESLVLGRPAYIYLHRDTTGSLTWSRTGIRIQ